MTTKCYKAAAYKNKERVDLIKNRFEKEANMASIWVSGDLFFERKLEVYTDL